MSFRRLAAAAAIAWWCFGMSSLAAQLNSTLDLNASWVDYEGFLGSGAASVTPTLRFDAPDLSLGASGSFVLFESGSTILQGLMAGGWRTPTVGAVRGEISGSAGLNKYQDFSAYGHVLGRTRLHLTGSKAGGWAGGATGQSYFADSSGTPYLLEVGAWTVRGSFSLSGTVTRTWFADTAYLDAVGSARWRDPDFELAGSLGIRTWSAGGGHGVYGELHAQIPLWKRLIGIVSGGRYPSDPVRGVIAANYISAGLRIDIVRAGPAPSALAGELFREFERPASPFVGEARLEIVGSSGTPRVLRVRVAGASSVTVMGDFTDWDPVSLRQVGDDRWEVSWSIPAGVYRVNVRVNGGAWVVPLGLRVEEDEFGGAVGIVVVGNR